MLTSTLFSSPAKNLIYQFCGQTKTEDTKQFIEFSRKEPFHLSESIEEAYEEKDHLAKALSQQRSKPTYINKIGFVYFGIIILKLVIVT